MSDPWAKPAAAWSAPSPPTTVAAIAAATDNPLHQMYGHLDKDALLLEWQKSKDAIEAAKEVEMNMRKYIVQRAFPEKKEGTNKIELGNGYGLKSVIKYNYNCDSIEKVEEGLDKLTSLGNEGAFIADRLVSWKASFKVTEYRQLQEDKEGGSKFAKDALEIISSFITITEAAPTLEITEPKKKK